MTKEEIIQSLVKIFRECGWESEIDITQIQNGVFEQLGLTSVETLEYLFLIENEFNITVDDDDLNSNLVKSLDNLAEYIISKR